MRLIYKKKRSNEFFYAVQYSFERATSAEDIRSILLCLRRKGYHFVKYHIVYYHDHSDSIRYIMGKDCHSTEELLNEIENTNMRIIEEIHLYGNIDGVIFPDEGILDAFIYKNI